MNKSINQIIPFGYEDNLVRVIEDKNGEPLWVAKDICLILELNNVSEALKKLDEDDLTSEKMMSGGQLREMKLVNESGLYTLILRSNKKEAKKFKKWVTSEVLPSIRKTGSYSINGKNSSVNYISNKDVNKDPNFIKIVEKLYGKKAARKYFSSILGIEYDELSLITDTYKPNEIIKEFINKSIDFDNSFTSSKTLYKTYVNWCEIQGIKNIFHQQKFIKAFNQTTQFPINFLSKKNKWL